MKAYVCTVGEKTTDICISQLIQYGFDVVILDEIQSWPEKYKRFLQLAGNAKEDCIRVDADVIVNKNVHWFNGIQENVLMAQGTLFDFYRNDIFVGQPVYYSKRIFPILEKNLKYLSLERPETSMWRLPEVDPHTLSLSQIMGSHGFFQDRETIQRAKNHKEQRKQMEHYDFNLVDKLLSL